MSQPVSATGVVLPAVVPAPQKPEKVLITGTGRCGTTFLICLFTLLGLDTGYKPETMGNFCWGHANAGMERPISHQVTFVKNPVLLTTLPAQIRSFRLFVILPLRDFDEAAKSRVRLGKNPGGLWGASDLSGQLDNYEKWVCKALIDIVQNDIPHIFLDFKRMTTNPEYLYKALALIMDRYSIHFEAFEPAWREADRISKPTQQSSRDLSGITISSRTRAF